MNGTLAFVRQLFTYDVSCNQPVHAAGKRQVLAIIQENSCDAPISFPPPCKNNVLGCAYTNDSRMLVASPDL